MSHPGQALTLKSRCVVSSRQQEIRLQTVHAETSAGLPHAGERPDPASAAAAFPDLRGGVAEKGLPGKHLLAWNHAAVPQNGEQELL